MGLMEKVFGDLNAKEVKKLEKTADRVLSYESEMSELTDGELKAKTEEFRERLKNGETLDDILPEAFAVCREGAWRTVGMKHFRVQIIGGIALHQGRISEMKTGEGKTLVATLPAYLNALEGRGVHIVTVNDYLAKRDCDWMGRIFRFLGLTVGCVIHSVDAENRVAEYNADITYGTNNEFGFDYLRDNMVLYAEEKCQRELNFAIIDEVDSILIDEARTPLIISGPGDESTGMYRKADDFVKNLKKETDYTMDEKDNQISLTDEGVEKCEKYFGIENFSDPDNMEINHHVLQALKGRYMMKRDKDYIVKDGEVVIVDEFTGRLMYGRRYSEGLHQAIEAKEGLNVQSESQTLATVTLQNYFRLYGKIAGMTGTAKTEEQEFRDIYNMDVVVIPTNREIQRKDNEDAIFKTQKGKFRAIADMVEERHKKGQPVLVGTVSIDISEKIADMLKKRGITNFNVLNAKHHEKEAEIVAQAGKLNAVTIATNMAGRGTDILLGGNAEFDAKKELSRRGFSPEQIEFAVGFEDSDDSELCRIRDEYHDIYGELKDKQETEREKVLKLGGLCIIGTERHESRRIDNQLRGRAGRQGDPGETVFCVSLEDELMRLFGGEKLIPMADRLGVDEDTPITAGVISKSIENAQKKVEGRNYSTRKYVLQYDNVMNKQREVIYRERNRVLNGENLRKYICGMTKEVVTEICAGLPDGQITEEILNDAEKSIGRICPDFLMKEYADMGILTHEDVIRDAMEVLEKIYDGNERLIGSEQMREVERMILLRVVDNQWIDHIDAMEHLKSGIGLRGLGGHDPAEAYAQEGFDMFNGMIAAIREETVKFCFGITIETSSERHKTAGKKKAEHGRNAQLHKEEEPVQEMYRREKPKTGRNEPCPCGSGKKYKNCCLKKTG